MLRVIGRNHLQGPLNIPPSFVFHRSILYSDARHLQLAFKYHISILDSSILTFSFISHFFLHRFFESTSMTEWWAHTVLPLDHLYIFLSRFFVASLFPSVVGVKNCFYPSLGHNILHVCIVPSSLIYSFRWLWRCPTLSLGPVSFCSVMTSA